MIEEFSSGRASSEELKPLFKDMNFNFLNLEKNDNVHLKNYDE